MSHHYRTQRPIILTGQPPMPFNWHSDPITQSTPITPTYKNTQNVRRFMTEHCGPDFKFNRPFMAWIIDGTAKTMGDVVDEWLRRRQEALQ